MFLVDFQFTYTIYYFETISEVSSYRSSWSFMTKNPLFLQYSLYTCNISNLNKIKIKFEPHSSIVFNFKQKVTLYINVLSQDNHQLSFI